MYTHKVTLTRPDASTPFFYTSLLSSQTYLDFKQSYIDRGTLINEVVEESSDQLSLVRTLTLVDKPSYEIMMTDWSSKNPFYVKGFLEYIQQHNHTVSFEAFEA